MSIIVYHGGTPITNDFKRPFAAANGGSTGYYVTTNKEFASSYGPVHTYEFQMRHDMTHNHLTPVQAINLNELTHYWEQYGEDINNPTPIKELTDNYVYDAMMECINATGEIQKIIDYMLSIGYNYASQSASGVYIVIGGLKEITDFSPATQYQRTHNWQTNPTVAWDINSDTPLPKEFNQFLDDGRMQIETNILGRPEVSIFRKVRGELVLHGIYSTSSTLFISAFNTHLAYPNALVTKVFNKKYTSI